MSAITSFTFFNTSSIQTQEYKMKKSFLLCATAVLLVACGGGGGGGVAATPDGTKINLDLSPKGHVAGKTDNGYIEGQNYTHMFYGAWLDDSKQLKELRYQGTETPRDNVPNSGIATYYGKAVRVDNHPLGGGVQILTEDTTSRINVNFGTKTVNGEITMPGLRRDITLHDGPLSGASYSGRASVLGNDSGRYEGKLFGPNAQETAGLVKFDTNSDLDTSRY